MQLKTVSDFKSAIDSIGFDKFWEMYINAYLSRIRPDFNLPSGNLEFDINSPIFSFDSIGELYEIALEHNDQITKKELGQYYTPKDVCCFMAKKLIYGQDQKSNLADVCCGTGNLIIEVLNQLGAEETRKLIDKKHLFLYDLDPTAIKLAIMKIGVLFAEHGNYDSYLKITNSINTNIGNFLSEKISLPQKCLVISNPPYGKLPPRLELWTQCSTSNTKDLYSVFMEKIAQQAQRAVIITPQSFIGGSKFSTLRSAMAKNSGGEVYSFDNVPSPLFCGRKKGIFNTNTSNSVRAAITLIDKKERGFRLTPMLRFKSEERSELFNGIEDLLGDNIYFNSSAWMKTPKSLEKLITAMSASTCTVSDFIEKDISKQDAKYKLTIPSTPRYFISATSRDLDRSSKIILYAKNDEAFDKLYVIINSTLSYLWWRIYDGGITLGKSTLLSLPVPEIDNNNDLKQLVHNFIKSEDNYLVNKLNAGKNNENVKFPPEYRKKLNYSLLKVLRLEDLSDKLYSVHSNSYLEYAPYWK